MAEVSGYFKQKKDYNCILDYGCDDLICWFLVKGVFFIPYTLCLIFVGLPLFYLEINLGQFTSQGAFHCWKMTPIFKVCFNHFQCFMFQKQSHFVRLYLMFLRLMIWSLIIQKGDGNFDEFVQFLLLHLLQHNHRLRLLLLLQVVQQRSWMVKVSWMGWSK